MKIISTEKYNALIRLEKQYIQDYKVFEYHDEQNQQLKKQISDLFSENTNLILQNYELAKKLIEVTK